MGTGRPGNAEGDEGTRLGLTHLLHQANRTVKAICKRAGIKDLRGKIIGSSHPANTVKATFEALDKVRSPEEVGAARGMVFTEVIPR